MAHQAITSTNMKILNYHLPEESTSFKWLSVYQLWSQLIIS